MMFKNSKILYFSIIGQPSILQSPPLPHEHRYGLAPMPSAFSVIGRRPPNFPSVNSHHHDFTTSLTHDPLMATGPRIQRSPTPATSSSWWRQPSISAHPQNMNNADYFGNPLLWLPHEQEHMRPHENLTYHNSAQAYRNFDFLNGSSPGSYYASTPRFFPEPAHSLHSIPTLGKDRPLTWEDRLGHGLMLDVSGNGFSPWQDMHQQKMVDRQQKQMQESVEKERNIMGMTNNRSSNFTDNSSVKSVKQSNKYLENHNAGPPTISNDSRLKVPNIIPPSESCLNVPVISNDSRHNVPGMPNSSRLNLLGMPNEPHLKIPPISSESSFNIPSLTSEPKLDIPSITNETQLNDASLSDDSRHSVTSSSGDTRHGITSIIGDSRLDVPVVTTESRLNTPPLMSKEPPQNLPPLSSQSRQNIPPMISESQQNLQQIMRESRQNLPENQSRLFVEKPIKYPHADTNMSIGNAGRSQPERSIQQLPSSAGIRGRAISPPKPDLPANLDLYKRDTVINTLESNTSNAPSIFSPPALIKSIPAPTIKSSKPSSGLPSPIKLHPARPTGGKPPLLERFRAPAVPRPGGDSSSDDGSSDGDDEDGESGSDSDSDDDGISEDGNDDDDDEVEEKVKKQPGQSRIQQLQKPQQSQQLKQPQQVGQQVFFIMFYFLLCQFPAHKAQKHFHVMPFMKCSHGDWLSRTIKIAD